MHFVTTLGSIERPANTNFFDEDLASLPHDLFFRVLAYSPLKVVMFKNLVKDKLTIDEITQLIILHPVLWVHVKELFFSMCDSHSMFKLLTLTKRDMIKEDILGGEKELNDFHQAML